MWSKVGTVLAASAVRPTSESGFTAGDNIAIQSAPHMARTSPGLSLSCKSRPPDLRVPYTQNPQPAKAYLPALTPQARESRSCGDAIGLLRKLLQNRSSVIADEPLLRNRATTCCSR